jgi:3-deoxy-D-manno-octulosonic-acid transferase
MIAPTREHERVLPRPQDAIFHPKMKNQICLQVLYNVGFMTFFFITGPFFLWRLWRRGKLLPQFGQRFGFYSKEVRERLAPGADLWIHAVSVGEVKLARVLIRRLREMRPDLRVVVSTTTGTGFPWPRNGSKTRRLHHLQSDRFSLERGHPPSKRSAQDAHPDRIGNLAELSLVREAAAHPGLSRQRAAERPSEERYRRLRWLVRPLLQEIDLVFAQDRPMSRA